MSASLYGPMGGSTSSVNASIFGTGSDGDLVISSGTTTLLHDANYRNVTISGTGRLQLFGFVLRVSGVLDLTNAPQGAIYNTNAAFSAALTEGSATGPTAGAIVNITAASTVPLCAIGSAGATGTTGAGAAPAAITAPPVSAFAFASLAGAVGGAGTNLGGAAGAAVTIAQSASILSQIRGLSQTGNAFMLLQTTTSVARVGMGCVGGASGGGDGTNSGGGGGAGGQPYGWLVLAANIINRGASTAAGAIFSAGSVGGNGGNGTAGNTGGGGGGGGGSGGIAWIIAGSLTGATATNAINVSGGLGGNGGNGFGTGLGGGGGPGGQTGAVVLTVLSPAATTVTAPGTAGGAATTTATITGATGAAGAALSVNL